MIMFTKNVTACSTVADRRFQRREQRNELMRASAPVVALLSSNKSMRAA